MDRELIRQARRADLKYYFERRGHKLKREGRKGHYRVEGNQGLIIKNNMFCQFGTGKKGNSLDCCRGSGQVHLSPTGSMPLQMRVNGNANVIVFGNQSKGKRQREVQPDGYSTGAQRKTVWHGRGTVTSVKGKTHQA